jgi:hypothetical protein
MLRTRSVSIVAMATALASLALVPAASTASPSTNVSGSILKPKLGMKIVAAGATGAVARAAVSPTGAFSLRIPKSRVGSLGLVVINPDGSSGGQILLATHSRRGYVRMTARTGAIGRVLLRSGYATVARDLPHPQYSKRSSVPLTKSGRPAAASSILKAIFAPKPKIIATCVKRYWKEGDGEGFELIDQLYRQVWGWNDMTQAQFDAITLRPTWLFWVKNSPREILARGFFVKSPECANDGEYTWKRMYGWNWLAVTNFVSLNQPVDDEGLLLRSVMWKYQTFTFAPGGHSAQITSPEGKKYVMVTRDGSRTTDASTLPSGWTMSPTYTLNRELKIELLGKETENFRTTNGDSFQGPLPAGFDLSQYAAAG